MEGGVSYNKKRLHGNKYFHELLERVDEIPTSVKELIHLSLSSYEMFRSFQKQLIATPRINRLIGDRVHRRMIDECGPKRIKKIGLRAD